LSRFHAVHRLIAAAFCIPVIANLTHAQTIPAACRSLIDAERKTIATANHSYSTRAAAGPGQKTRTVEAITVGGVIYVEYNGKWKRSPATPARMLAQMDSNLATTRNFSCAHVGDESVAGTAASVFTTHTDNEGVKADTRIWVAKGSGLVLRVEDDQDTGGGDKAHVSIRYDYTNVRAPAAP
jgi:hypothetical protein